MGNAGICPECGGRGERWNGRRLVRCWKCRGTGVLQPYRYELA